MQDFISPIGLSLAFRSYEAAENEISNFHAAPLFLKALWDRPVRVKRV